MAEKNKKEQTGEQEQDLSQILQVRRDKLAALQAAGKDPFQQTKFTVSAHAQEIKDHFDEMEGKPVTIAGRLMSKRGMGKVSFCDLQDKSGRIQLYARKDEMDEAVYNEFKKYDIGDLVGVEGEVFRTQRGGDERPVQAGHPSLQVPAAPAGEVPRPCRTRSCATASGMWTSSSPRLPAQL